MESSRSRKHVRYPETPALVASPAEAWLTWGLFGAGALLVIVSAALV